MNNLDKQYTNLLQDILDNGVEKKDRTGTGTLSIFGRQIRHKMSDGFPLITTKKLHFKSIVVELLWFLRGDTNIKFLVDNNCHIWDGDAYKNYWFNWRPMLEDCGEDLTPYTQEEFINKIKTDDEFANKWGELGPIYGKQWRDWKGFHEGQHDILKVVYGTEGREHYLVGIDQIQNLINDLKTNPDSRRLMVNAWNVGELDQMVLPPCHYVFQVYTRELSMSEKELWYKNNNINPNKPWYPNWPTRAISLMWNQRSVDTFLGLPFNIASYGLLLEIIAKEVNMVPDQLIGNLGDVHLYSNHIEQAKEQIGRKYTPDERSEMLKESMGYENYHNAIEELMPFGGGLSEYYEIHKIPYHTREPYPLPTLKHMKTDEFYKSLGEDLRLITHLDNTDFVVENYQSHPSIKAPLSN
jgi:thymidylate synthase